MEKRNRDIDRRSRCLLKAGCGSGPVVYWMSRDQRVRDNWALLWAMQEGIIRQRGVVVVFCLVPDYPGANLRHYSFMLKAMPALQGNLRDLNIDFRILEGAPPLVLPSFLREVDACSLVTDFDPLRIKQQWKSEVVERISLSFYEVDAHNIIPAWVVSDKKEYAAYTIRPKVNRLLEDYLTEFPRLHRHPFGKAGNRPEIDMDRLMRSVADRRVSAVSWCEAGEQPAQKTASDFVAHRLSAYSRLRNDPCENGQSGLSPYLHFGHLSPQRLALEVADSMADTQACEDFLEELIVRRELADNFCLYEPSYDSVEGFPEWAQRTLQQHLDDERPHVYSLDEFEHARTHEALWNSCQVDLVRRGKLHGYMRMYWAKKILEWTRDPMEAMEYAIVLNDRYSLDGRDPNGYTGIAWSIGGVHDRAWRERAVFGKIRYMNENGCRRKFDVDRYIGSRGAVET